MAVLFILTKGLRADEVHAWPVLSPVKAFAALQEFFAERPAARPFGRERGMGPVSNSELRRWLKNRSVLINGSCPGADDLVDRPVREIVFFPKNPKSRITML